MTTTYDVIAVTTYYSQRDISWHVPCHNKVSVDGSLAMWDEDPYRIVGMDVGFEGQCIALILEHSGVTYKLYTDTPTEGSTRDGIMDSLRRHVRRGY